MILTPARPSAIAALLLAAAVIGCTEETARDVTPTEYRASLAAICATTDVRLEAVEGPPESADVATFATTVGEALGDEADLARELTVSDGSEEDHRAFVRNTDAQSAAWSNLAATAPDDPAFADLAREIGELTLGRNDLSAEMGVDGCIRTPAEP
ncbi:MAG: hypothetical protein ACR2O6_06210 [Ilumatobacteraceae bacterium]